MAAPKVTGSDGSTTGTADFQGNFDNITDPVPTEFYLQRLSDCSLNYAVVSESISGSNVSLTLVSSTTHYERALHQMAALSTAGGVFPSGCPEKSTGISSRVGVAVGIPKPNVFVAALIVPTSTGTVLRTRVYTLATLSAVETFVTAIPNPNGVATADLNGDGFGDLVVTNYSGQIYVMLGKSDGTFSAPVSYTIAGFGSVAAVIDDVSGDGKLDIVAVSDDQQISVFTGKGDGTFNAPTSFTALLPGSATPAATPIQALVTADLRGLGRRDILCSNGIVLLNNGTGTFTQVSAPAFPIIQSSAGQPLGLATGDFNNDGKIDLVVTTGYTLYTWFGKGDGTFTQGTSYASINNTGYVTVSDLDGDGNLDIYTGQANGGFYSGDANEPGYAYALMGHGDGTFQGAPQITGAYNGNNLADVNGDGIPDLVTEGISQYNFATGTYTVHLADGKGGFAIASSFTAQPTFVLDADNTLTGLDTTGADTYAVGDINGDGKADVVFTESNLADTYTAGGGFFRYNGGPVLFTALSKGDGTFQTPVPVAFPQIAPAGDYDITLAVSSMQIADFNKDGKNDLVLFYNETALAAFGSPAINSYNQGFVVLPGVGNGTFGAPVLTSTYSSNTAPGFLFPTIVNTLDLNGDGKTDLLVLNHAYVVSAGIGSEQDAVQVFLGNGDGSFKAPSPVPYASAPGFLANVALADFNKDGKIDIAILSETNAAQGQLSIALGNGDGTFKAPSTFNISGGDAVRSAGIAAADFDGDGNVDLALLDANDISGVFYGKGDGTFTSVPFNGNTLPKDLINLYAGGTSVAVDLNKDGRPDILTGDTILLNLYGTAISTLAATSTALTQTATTITTGGSITFTAKVTSTTSGTPTGTMTFLDGTTILGTAPLSAGVATYPTTALTTGTHSITASYGGDTIFAASVSSISTITVNAPAAVATTTALASTATTAVAGTSITFTATVLPGSGTAAPTGTVTFLDGTTTLGTGTLSAGVATFAISTLAIGSHSITASYAGVAGTFNASTSTPAIAVTITAPVVATTTTLASTATSAVSGTSITFTATVTPASGTATPTGTVTFLDGTATLGTGTLSSGKATYTTSTLALGTHSIVASYGGLAGAFSVSASTPALVVAITAATTPDFTLALSSNAATVTHGTAATTTISVTPLNGFSAATSLTCGGAPANSTCAIAPTSVTPSGTAASTATLTLQTSVQTGALAAPAAPGSHLAPIVLAATLPFGLLALLTSRRRNRASTRLLNAFFLLSGLLSIAACGSSSPSSTVQTAYPTAGTYPLTVTASGGSVTHAATFTVTIQ